MAAARALDSSLMAKGLCLGLVVSVVPSFSLIVTSGTVGAGVGMSCGGSSRGFGISSVASTAG